MYEEVISYFCFNWFLCTNWTSLSHLAPPLPTFHFLVNKQICRVCPKPWPPSQNYCCLTNQVDALCTTLDCRLNMMWPSWCAAWLNRRSRLFCVLMIIFLFWGGERRASSQVNLGFTVLGIYCMPSLSNCLWIDSNVAASVFSIFLTNTISRFSSFQLPPWSSDS